MISRLIVITALALATATHAQTLNVVTGNVTAQYPATQTGEMTYSNGGQQLTIMGKTYTVGDIDQIYIDHTAVSDSTVTVSYNGASAAVTISGDIAKDITATVSGAHVNIVQGKGIDNGAGEVEYILSGTSNDGEFYMSGTYKATVQLAGLALTNASGSPVNIQDGKRIKLSVKKNTVNTLTDCANGSQKACLVIKGHAEFQGNGTLNIYGNTNHAIKASDYMTLKNCTLNVVAAVGDGIQANGYFQQKSGVISISNVGDDGIQVELDGDTPTGETDGHDDEDSGSIYLDGGTLTASVTATAAKCLKADGNVKVNSGTLTLKAAGDIDLTGTDDEGNIDPSYTAGIKTDAAFIHNGGTIDITVTGTAGRGVSANDIVTNGGTLTINNSGAGKQGTNDNYTAKCLKGENFSLNAGTITLTASGTGGKGILAGSGTKTSSGFRTTWSNVTGSFSMGNADDGTGPTLTINTTGTRLGTSSPRLAPGGGGFPGGGGNPWNPGGETTDNSSSAKAIKSIPPVYIYGGTTEISTATDGAEGLESKTGIDIEGGQHYMKCYDDCINSGGQIYFNGGTSVCYSFGNDAVDSNAGNAGAITIGNGAVFAYNTKGSPEEGLDCDNNSNIRITGTGIGISAGGVQSSASGTISNAQQGYAFTSSPSSYAKNTYYTLCDAAGNNLVTYSFEAAFSNKCSLLTATGMKSGSTYYVKSSTTAPTDAVTSWHGLYLGSSATGSTTVATIKAK